ncbi:site-specific DNA-methyltransferase [Caulobacter sp. Root343]|uniref:DNA-methyltransferase n=1 Tax=Caulobacter sp. Root343 TaxID=1736520 RepID=UPI0006F8E521|nr:site-specific DNA-methyltransferase [Caulobacter sp. Root343]KQV66619.1 hypothetical protein ASC70_12355 [Caulobacter sp. Root343]
MTVSILVGDCLAQLRALPSNSVHTCICSPPYFRLRDYDVKGQIGLERTPAAYIKKLVAVFREVRRVLRKDGTLWVNIGDSYVSVGGTAGRQTGQKFADRRRGKEDICKGARIKTASRKGAGLKPKDLIGIPWMLAFALREDGWFLRQDIIWNKPNPMPESVEDRCTKSHEYIFLLSKSRRYYFDAGAIAEPITTDPKERYEQRARVTGRGEQAAAAARGQDRDKSGGFPPRRRSGNLARKPGAARGCPDGTGANVCGSIPWEGSERNKRSVWTVASKPLKVAHFAAYPPELITPCVLAGSPRGGVVLDPFGGAGTTALVAERLGRDSILIELNPDYAAMAQRRLKNELAMVSGADDRRGLEPLPLFDGAAA